MSKPVHGIDWLYNCLQCGNKKSTFIKYNDYEKYKCSKCNYNFIINKNK